jgi:hypothetical protein
LVQPGSPLAGGEQAICVAQAGQKADPHLESRLRGESRDERTPAHKPIVHFVGSIPLPDGETVFRTLVAATGPHLKRLPDGETGIRKTWIRFLQQVLADNPAIEVASDVLPFKSTQWDGKLLREIPRLRVGNKITPLCFAS